jgi:hypothetical protein
MRVAIRCRITALADRRIDDHARMQQTSISSRNLQDLFENERPGTTPNLRWRRYQRMDMERWRALQP